MSLKIEKRKISFVILAAVIVAVFAAGWGGAEPVYALNQSKQTALVVPVEFSNSSAQNAVSFAGTIAAPEVRYYKTSIFSGTSFLMNDVYNSRNARASMGIMNMGNGKKYITPNSSVNNYLKNATFGLHQVVPYYLSNDVRSFKAFTVNSGYKVEDLRNPNKESKTINVSKMTECLNSVIDQINDNHKLTDETLTRYFGTEPPVRDNKKVGTISDGQMDQVVFLVNVSNNRGVCNPYNFRSYNIRDSRGGGLKPLRAQADGGLEWEISINNYSVVFVNENLLTTLTHETMHAKGVHDLYIEPQENQYSFPAGDWDIQSKPVFSGPYFPQRCDMLPLQHITLEELGKPISTDSVHSSLNLQLKQGDAGKNDFSQTRGDLHLKDINTTFDRTKPFEQQLNEVVCKATVRYESWAPNDSVEYFIEYRHPKTDLNADLNAGDNGDRGVLLLYTTFEAPRQRRGKFIYLLGEFNLDDCSDLEMQEWTSGEEVEPPEDDYAEKVFSFMNSGVKRGFLIPNEPVSQAEGDTHEIVWRLERFKTNEDRSVDFHFSITAGSESYEEITYATDAAINWL